MACWAAKQVSMGLSLSPIKAKPLLQFRVLACKEQGLHVAVVSAGLTERPIVGDSKGQTKG